MTKAEYEAEWYRHYRATCDAYNAWQNAPGGQGGAAIRALDKAEAERKAFLTATKALKW